MSFELEIGNQCSSSSNIAFLGTASQSSEYSAYPFPASNAVNGITTDFTHTLETSTSEESWELLFTGIQQFNQITLHNRDGYESNLRDIFVSIENTQGAEVFRSALLNPENQLYNPATIVVDLPPLVKGQKVKVQRLPDPDISGIWSTSGSGYVLSLGEVVVQGCVAPQGGQ